MSTKWVYTEKAEADGVGKAGTEVNTDAGGPTQEYLELHKYCCEEVTAGKEVAGKARPDAGSLAHPAAHASMSPAKKVNE